MILISAITVESNSYRDQDAVETRIQWLKAKINWPKFLLTTWGMLLRHCDLRCRTDRLAVRRDHLNYLDIRQVFALSLWLVPMLAAKGQPGDQTEIVVFKGRNASLPCTITPSNTQFVLEWVKSGYGPIYTLLSPQGEHHHAFGYDKFQQPVSADCCEKEICVRRESASPMLSSRNSFQGIINIFTETKWTDPNVPNLTISYLWCKH
ncbi:hypothetical protein M514_18081 [Trichuris suis]|uniref:Ig-like domain-containing protein n=1 Tax=Trichuris suis TaxID=68888 RepID=A0A085NJQ0_9BILA|nr:hypothetical protein M514_18081 [Trichuris suis]